MTTYGLAIWRPTDVEVGSVIVEGHNGVRYRVTDIDRNPHNWAAHVLHLTPIDNPLPRPRGNASGRGPIRLALGNILGFPEDMLESEWRPSGAWRLCESDLAALSPAAYARHHGFDESMPEIDWTAYEEGPTP